VQSRPRLSGRLAASLDTLPIHRGASSVACDYRLYFVQVKDPPALIHLGEKWQ
jgi:hypothetical protein